MKKIIINRPKHIAELLEETQKEFKRRGIQITIDQAHCLQDLINWFSFEIEEAVDYMITDYCKIEEPQIINDMHFEEDR